MKKYLLLLTAFFFIAGCQSIPPASGTPETTVTLIVSKAVPKNSLLDKAAKERQEVFRGSGFLITESGLLLTAAHLVEDTTTYVEVLVGERRYPADTVALNSEKDIALLKLSTRSTFPFLSLASTTPQTGEDIYVLKDGVKIKGEILAENQSIEAASSTLKKNLSGLLKISFSLEEGESGTPLLSAEGKVLAMSLAVDPENPGTSFAIPVETITKALLKEGLKSQF